MASLTWREKKALRNLKHMQWENASQLYVGEGTIASLLTNGWAEKVDGPPGDQRLKITEAGIEVLDRALAMEPSKPEPPDEGEWY